MIAWNRLDLGGMEWDGIGWDRMGRTGKVANLNPSPVPGSSWRGGGFKHTHTHTHTVRRGRDGTGHSGTGRAEGGMDWDGIWVAIMLQRSASFVEGDVEIAEAGVQCA